jgi:hypothetical protein
MVIYTYIYITLYNSRTENGMTNLYIKILMKTDWPPLNPAEIRQKSALSGAPKLMIFTGLGPKSKTQIAKFI